MHNPSPWLQAACTAALVVVVVLGSVPARGQVPADLTVLAPVAVTATRATQPSPELLADVTVIGADEIARAGAQGIADLLQRQPGVEIIRNGGPAGVSGVFLRGANAAQTLVLIDGQRVGSSSTGAATLEAIPLDQVERIEILRGPASSLYGADAIGGVIQVFTRRGGGAFAASASVGGGTYGTWNASGGASGSAGPLAYAVRVGTRASDGFNAIVDPASFAFNPDRDGFKNASVSASASLAWAPGQSLDARYLRNRLNAQFDGGPDHDDRTITVLETWQVESRNAMTPFWMSRLAAGASIDDSISKIGFGDFPFRTTQRQYSWQNDLDLAQWLALPGMLTAGYERREERVATDAGFAVTSRDTDAIFAIYRLALDAHSLQANLRHDDSTQFGGRTTGTIAYGYRISAQWRASASYGTGFKAPTFNDLYFPDFSNPALVPESSRSVEGGVHWANVLDGGTIEARAIVYRNRVRDLIVFQCDADFNCAPQNVARATLEGVSAGLDLRLHSGTTASASLDIGSPKDDQTANLLPRRARQHGTFTLGQPVGPVRLGVEVVASSHRYDDAANATRLAGYAIVNLTAEWQAARGVTLFVRADNVFDRDYALAASYATGGATVFGGVRWRL